MVHRNRKSDKIQTPSKEVKRNKYATLDCPSVDVSELTEIALRDRIQDKLWTAKLRWKDECVTVRQLWYALREFDEEVFDQKSNDKFFLREPYWFEYSTWWFTHKTKVT